MSQLWELFEFYIPRKICSKEPRNYVFKSFVKLSIWTLNLT